MSTSLQARIETDLKQAMRDRNELARDTLRMVISDLKKKQLELLKDDLTPDEELAVLQRAVKTRQESVEQFEKAGRQELAQKERAEIDVIRAYLPQALSEEETRAAVDAAIRAAGSPTKKDLGGLMKGLMAAHRGRIDGKLVQRLLGERLA
jgi:uncharacterized protein YqeY